MSLRVPGCNRTIASACQPATLVRWQVGDKAQVYRTDGSWAPATIDDYDEKSGTYTMRLEDGRMKYFVEADEVKPLGT